MDNALFGSSSGNEICECELAEEMFLLPRKVLTLTSDIIDNSLNHFVSSPSQSDIVETDVEWVASMMEHNTENVWFFKGKLFIINKMLMEKLFSCNVNFRREFHIECGPLGRLKFDSIFSI